MDIGANNAWYSSRFKLIPEIATGNPRPLMRRSWPLRGHVHEDRIVPEIDRLDPDDGLVLAGAKRAAGIVSRPFPEGAFCAGLFRGRRDLSFGRDFTVSGDRQAGQRPLDDGQRHLQDATGHIEFRKAPRELRERGHHDQRITFEGQNNGTCLALLPISFRNQPTLLARTLPQAEKIGLVQLQCLRRYPDIRWIFSHTGGAISILADRIERLLMRPPYAEQNRDGIGPMLNPLHFDMAGTESAATINALRALVPQSQILFGSDMPFVSPSKSADTLTKLAISATERDAIAFANAKRLFAAR